MLKKLSPAKRISWGIRIGALIVLLVILYMGVAELRDFYSDKIGFTAERAIYAYFEALGQGDYAEVYRLSNKERLTDIYGRAITQQEFRRQLENLTGRTPLSFTQVRATSLCEDGDYRYFVVQLYSDVGGTTRSSRLIVEVCRYDGSWVITYPFAIVL